MTALRNELERTGLAVPRIVCGGTGSFPIYAEKNDPAIELSPGTCIFNDAGYSEAFPDLVFKPATAILTRVISRPTADRITLDLGYKAVASDPPAGKRVILPDLPDAEQVLQNEEHLVLRTPRAGEFQPGDELYAIPRHICPSVALAQTGVRRCPRKTGRPLGRRGPRPVADDLNMPATDRLSTGISDLDDLLGGGLLPGTLTVCAGATGIGKTQLGLHFANQGMRNKKANAESSST